MLAGALKADSEEQVPEMNVSYKYSSLNPPALRILFHWVSETPLGSEWPL